VSALDVVIVAYGNREVIGACVEGARQLPGVGEVVVVDHGHDGSGAVAAARGARVLSNPANPGFGTGQNRGVATTTARYVLLLNPDADPDPEGIAAGIRALDADPQVAIVQGVIANRVTGQPERSQGRELGPVHLLGRAVSARRLLAYAWVRRVFGRVGTLADHVERAPTRPVSVESLAATCVLVRRRALDQIGGFDESYFLYGEDLDLCRRLRNRGWRLVALPHRFAQHDGGASSSTSTDRELSWWRGTLRFSALWWSDPAWMLAIVAATIQCARLCLRDPRISRRAWRALMAEPIQDRRARRRARSGDVEHPLQRDAGPLAGVRIDGDLIHDLAAHE
jgi:GT2 family glycosyltransferase